MLTHTEEEPANERDFVRQLLNPKLPAREGACPVSACFFPSKSFLVMFLQCQTPQAGLLCQNSRGVASDCPFRPLLSLCPQKLEKHTGENATQEGMPWDQRRGAEKFLSRTSC